MKLLWSGMFERPADHHANKCILVRICQGDVGDLAAIAENRGMGSDPENFVQLVRDIDHGNAACLEAPDHSDQFLELDRRQARSRLVHGDDPRFAEKRLADFHDLRCASRSEPIRAVTSIWGSRLARMARAFSRMARLSVKTPRRVIGLPRKHVLRNVELGDLLEFLVDERNARTPR